MLRHQKWAGVLLMGARKEGRREPRRATLPTEVNRNASVPRLNGQAFFPNLFKQPTPGLGIPPKQTVPSPSAFISLYMDTSCQLVHRAVRIYLPFGDQLDLCFKRLIANLFCKLSENFLSQQRKQFLTG